MDPTFSSEIKMSFIIGIDPGASGAVAIIKTNGELVHVFDMPSVEERP